MKRLCVALLCLYLASSALAAGDREWKLASGLYAIGVGLDLYTTDRVLNTGRARELNPFLGPYPSDSTLYGFGILGSEGAYLCLNKLRKTHPRAAKNVLWGVGVLHIGLAIHNRRLEVKINGKF